MATSGDAVRVRALPFELRWLSRAVSFEAGDDWLRLAAGPRTDWFVDPGRQSEAVTNAPVLLGHVRGDYLLSARVSVDFSATFDAGVLMLHAAERTWAKLCFELSPDRQPMVVSVVTRVVSDDCNSFVVDGKSVWLRIAKIGSAFAFHASTSGRHWQLVRHFSLGDDVEPALGFEAQSPTGGGCAATFEEIRFEARRLGDLRSGD